MIAFSIFTFATSARPASRHVMLALRNKSCNRLQSIQLFWQYSTWSGGFGLITIVPTLESAFDYDWSIWVQFLFLVADWPIRVHFSIIAEGIGKFRPFQHSFNGVIKSVVTLFVTDLRTSDDRGLPSWCPFPQEGFNWNPSPFTRFA